MKAVRIIISVVSWAWAALAVYAIVKDRKELRHMQERTAETTRKTRHHF